MKIVKALGILILLLVAVVLFNTFTYKSKQLQLETLAPAAVSDECFKHLSEAVQIKTVSYEDAAQFDSVSFGRLIHYLKNTYPLVDSMLQRKVINKYSLLYKWEGTDKSLKPIVLMGHMDVVPVDSSELKNWNFQPFAGTITDSAVCGRGTLDDKVNVIGILETAEQLLKERYAPKRTIYMAFGHDEEIGGENGAAQIAAYLQAEHVEAEFVLDEGMVITRGLVPGVQPDVALVGVCEKGYATLELSVEAESGHSSMPAKETPIGILSAAVAKVEQHPMDAAISEPVQHFLDYVGPEMSFFSKLAFANQWLLKSVILSKYQASNSGNATVRTTAAPTIFKSGFKENVLPSIATAVVNYRILPGQTSDDVLAYVTKTVSDERVKIKKLAGTHEAPAVSDIQSEGFKQIEKSVKQVFDKTLVAPSLMIGATDEKHYEKISKNLFRFLPVVFTSDDLKRLHGANEKISKNSFKNCIRFYRQLILNSCG